MFLRHSKPLCRLPLEIKLDHHSRFVPDNPTIMSRRDCYNLGRNELHNTTVAVLYMNLAASEQTHMGMLPQIGSHNRFHMLRPAEPRRINHTLHTLSTGTRNI